MKKDRSFKWSHICVLGFHTYYINVFSHRVRRNCYFIGLFRYIIDWYESASGVFLLKDTSLGVLGSRQFGFILDKTQILSWGCYCLWLVNPLVTTIGGRVDGGILFNVSQWQLDCHWWFLIGSSQTADIKIILSDLILLKLRAYSVMVGTNTSPSRVPILWVFLHAESWQHPWCHKLTPLQNFLMIPKHQSGESLVWPAGRNEILIEELLFVIIQGKY